MKVKFVFERKSKEKKKYKEEHIKPEPVKLWSILCVISF